MDLTKIQCMCFGFFRDEEVYEKRREEESSCGWGNCCFKGVWMVPFAERGFVAEGKYCSPPESGILFLYLLL